MTPTQREAALLLAEGPRTSGELWARAAALLRELAAEPVQEPVIWIQSNHLQHAQNGPHFARTGPTKLQSDYVPLYAHPPQQRVPLTKVQLWSLPEMRGWFPQDHYRLEALARAIERAHGITGEPT